MKFMRIGSLAWLTCWLLSGLVLAQDIEPPAGPESLRLPEVVITGIDRSKIHRMIPKVDLAPEFAPIDTTAKDRSEALLRQGDAALLRQARQAEAMYVQAVALDPSSSAVYVRLGNVYRVLKRYMDAAEAYEQALALNAGLIDAHYQLGLLYEEHLQEAEQALKQYQLYVQAGGTDPRVNIWLRNITRQLADDTPEPSNTSTSASSAIQPL